MESSVVRDRVLLRWDCRDMRPGMAHAVGACVQCRTRVRAKVAIEHLLEGGLCRPPATGPADATVACAKCMKST
jgi:hypothetical protein